jgi:4-alpha-glucanotransferase
VRDWRNAAGGEERVSDESLIAVLGALGYPADNERTIHASLALLEEERRAVPLLLTGEIGKPTALPLALAQMTQAELVPEHGEARTLTIEGGALQAVPEPGYHRLVVANRELVFAMAPPRCFGIDDETHARRRWGAAVQVYALRGQRERAYGGFGELAETAALLGKRGADALAISPVHALYPGDGGHYSPYSPSSRLFLNTAFADPAVVGLPPLPPHPYSPLIDWGTGLPEQLADLRSSFAALGDTQRTAMTGWVNAGGEVLHRQAQFDALLCRFRPQGAYGWRDWPQEFRDPASPAVAAFAREAADEVDFHLFAQWLADRGLEAAHHASKEAGMALGLISDLAVGVAPNGADSWSFGRHMLSGLGVGAPPDPLGPEGQNWCLTTFSPRGLAATGYAPWIAMIRSALVHAGGVRIDHAFGLARLWVVPDGGQAKHGAYLTYPFDDLLRLLALESHRERAFVVAEDLGTAPHGFHQAIIEREMPGMRVLWFEREGHGGFRPPSAYDPRCMAMTGTHDTPTVAGWWRGTDLRWSERLGRFRTPHERESAEHHRAHERGQLWSAAGNGAPQPAPDEPEPAVTAATAFIAATPSPLALFPLEDILAIDESPNIPGTVTEHPNWRRRLAAPLGEMLDRPGTAARIGAISRARTGQ